VINDESDRFNPRDPKPADAGKPSRSAKRREAREILHGVPASSDEIDRALKPCLDITIEELDPVELAVLRLSTWELLKRVDVPYRVVINEGIELAKVFGSTDGHKFVNGVLDKLAPSLRGPEVAAHKR